MRPQISLRLIFSFSFSCQVSHNSGEHTSWRQFCMNTFLRAEVREGRCSGRLLIAYYVSFLKQNTAAHAFHQHDVIPALEPGPDSQSRETISANSRRKCSQVSPKPPRLIAFTNLLEMIVSGVIKALRQNYSTEQRVFE